MRDVLRGALVCNLPQAKRTFPRGRICLAKGCDTKLSIYSGWQYCWQHEAVHPYTPRRGRKRKEVARVVGGS